MRSYDLPCRSSPDRTESQPRPNQSSSSAERSPCKITKSQAPTFCSETCRLSLSLTVLCMFDRSTSQSMASPDTDLSSCQTERQHLPQQCRKPRRFVPGLDLDLPERSDTEETTSASDAPASDDGSSTDDVSDDPAESTTDEPTLTVPDSPDERASTQSCCCRQVAFAEADQLLAMETSVGIETIVRAEAFVQAALESLTADG